MNKLNEIISLHANILDKARRKAIEDFKETKLPNLKDKASNLRISTIAYNFYRKHPSFEFTFLGSNIVALVKSWREDDAKKAANHINKDGDGASNK
ncbi:hypothetical protein PanWU01x14_170720 [Parasponia andersonii]|uniref:Uncharacterized protein n=1 Tax=Parasponia andersonii TaxID=3476 RepID=A0A2P5C9Y5_PARAD|nr:hypothetical protein PanWU01x14_170720 [Parasponia andersonii]